jgi:hypothetical protein
LLVASKAALSSLFSSLQLSDLVMIGLQDLGLGESCPSIVAGDLGSSGICEIDLHSIDSLVEFNLL